jgi:hypothetical protein
MKLAGGRVEAQAQVVFQVAVQATLERAGYEAGYRSARSGRPDAMVPSALRKRLPSPWYNVTVTRALSPSEMSLPSARLNVPLPLNTPIVRALASV